MMENYNSTENNAQFKDVLDSFISSYSQRDETVNFSEWLSDMLGQKIPDITNENSRDIANDIIKGISDYNQTLNELNTAIEAGQSQEDWLAENLADTYEEMPADEAGERLKEIEYTYAASNEELMQTINGASTELADSENVKEIEWNKYSLKNTAYEIGQQAALNGIAVAAVALKNKSQGIESGYITKAIDETLKGGLMKDSSEIKAVVAGAVKIAAENGLENALPFDTPIDTICDLAGAAVEGAEAMLDAANGDITITEALDKTGRAAVAAGCRIGKRALTGVVSKIPVVGPILIDTFSELLDHLETPQFINDVYEVVRDTAAVVWEGVKATGRKILGFVDNLLFN